MLKKGRLLCLKNRGSETAFAVRLLTLIVLLVSFTIPASTQVEVFEKLAAAGKSRPEQYPELRRELEKAYPEGVDVDKATENSWEAGLMAVILNERVKHREVFAKLDQYHPALQANGEWNYMPYDLFSKDRKDVTAEKVWLFERIWKGCMLKPSYRGVTEQKLGLVPFRMQMINSLLRRGSIECRPELWRKLIKAAQSDDLMRIACFSLPGHSDPQSVGLLTDLIISQEASDEAKVYVLTGIERHQPSWAGKVLLGSFDKWDGGNGRMMEVFLRTMASLQETGTRAKLYEILEDSQRQVSVRLIVLEALGRYSMETDASVIEKLIRKDVPDELMNGAAAAIRWLPIEKLRPIARPLLTDSLGEAAISSLVDGMVLGREEDISFLRSLTQRADLPEVNRQVISKKLYLRELHEINFLKRKQALAAPAAVPAGNPVPEPVRTNLSEITPPAVNESNRLKIRTPLQVPVMPNKVVVPIPPVPGSPDLPKF